MNDSQQTQPKDVDKVLNELAAIIMRASAFRRFMYTNLQVCVTYHFSMIIS